jgi:tetratricopeptide (TPR) repeat protein
MKLNPYDPYGYLRYGMCEDWIGRHAEAWPFYQKALDHDPNGYYVTAWVGWHYVETGDYPAAKIWFERSERLDWDSNTMAETYIPMLNQRLMEAATNSSPFAEIIQR